MHTLRTLKMYTTNLTSVYKPSDWVHSYCTACEWRNYFFYQVASWFAILLKWLQYHDSIWVNLIPTSSRRLIIHVNKSLDHPSGGRIWQTLVALLPHQDLLIFSSLGKVTLRSSVHRRRDKYFALIGIGNSSTTNHKDAKSIIQPTADMSQVGITFPMHTSPHLSLPTPRILFTPFRSPTSLRRLDYQTTRQGSVKLEHHKLAEVGVSLLHPYE